MNSVSPPARRTRQSILRASRIPIEQLENRLLLSTAVTTYHNDNQSSGLNSTETQLTPGNVNISNFGKHFSITLDGQAYAQPLYVPGLNVTAGPNPGVHDVVFEETEHDTLFAIDADSGAVLYQVSFTGVANGLPNATSVTSVPTADLGSSDTSPEVGITSTPVIDSSTNSLYLLAKTKEIVNNDTANPHYVQRLYKLNMANGTYTGAIIGDTIRNTTSGNYTNNTSIYTVGTGDGSTNVGGQNRVYFNAMRQFSRAGMVLYNNEVYLAWASHGDQGPYHGWLIAFNKTTLAPTRALDTTPNGGLGGIWQGGGIPAMDSNGNFYFMTGNGSFNTASGNFNAQGFPIDADYGDCFIKVSLDPTSTVTSENANGWGLKVTDFFSPFNNSDLNGVDRDLGSGGVIILPDSAGDNDTKKHLLMGAGKESKVYLINRDNMGKFDPATDHVVQELGNGIGNSGAFGSPAFYNGLVYYAGVSTQLRAFSVISAQFTQVMIAPDTIGTLDGTVSISSNGTNNGIAWLVDRTNSVLKAYNAANLSNEIWTSAQASGSRDALGTAEKFSVPTVADGLVMVGTTTSLVIYGPPQPATSAPAAPTNLNATAASGIQINLAWTDNATNEDGYQVYQSSDNNTFNLIATLGVNAVSYSATNLQVGTQYWFKVRAFNAYQGQSFSAYSNTATATTNSQLPNLDFSNGFASSGGTLNYNGSAKIVNGFGELTDGGMSEAGTVWSKSQQDIRKFNTNFTFTQNGTADGFTFAIQRSSATVVGGAGGNLGYQGIATSIGIKFDLYQNVSETGLYQNGAAPDSTGATSTKPNVDLHSGHIIRAVFTYDGTTLEETLTDTTTNLVYTRSYTINIPTVIGGNNAWVGFIGGTGGEVSVQDIHTWVFATVPYTAPTPPSGLTAAAASGTQVNLHWTDTSGTEDGFKIFRKQGAGGTYGQVGTVGVNVTNYIDTGLTPDLDYYWQVFATNVAGDSTPSNEVTVHTPIPPITPTGAHVTAITPTTISMAWTDHANNEDGFTVLRKSGLSQYLDLGTLPPNMTTFFDDDAGAGLTPGTDYDYHIQEFNVAGYSDFTGFIIDTPTLAPTGLGVTPGLGAITFSWAEPSNNLDDGEITYNVYRSMTSNGQSATPIATGLLDTSFFDTTATPGVPYFYKVTAVDSGGESARSAEISGSATNTVSTSANGKSFYVRLDDSHEIVEVRDGVDANAPIAYLGAYDNLGNVTFNLNGSNDALYIDLSNGSPVTSGGFTVNASGDDAIHIVGSAGADSVTFAAGSISATGGGAISYGSIGSLSFDGKNGFDTLAITGGPIVSIPTTQHLQSLSISGTGSAQVAQGSSALIVTRALSIGASSTFDLSDNDLILDYSGSSQLPAVQSLINSARTGNWTGTGLTSSAARNRAQHNTTLGAMEASDYKTISAQTQTFDGEAIDNDAVLVHYTYYGDANFSGIVDGGDYSRIDATFNKEHTAGNIGGWLNGDFNGDGTVDGADYALIDGAFNSQLAALRSPYSLPPVAKAPAKPALPARGIASR